ncbi:MULTISPECIES: hypothetical protein [Brevibacillus]|uniref:hypothetical protein n=1 Tax=Brevibacillus TaxID=55080 RepID=UPI000E2EFBF0|nr:MULTISPECIES: hypothetical protein [Brevibacillus]AYB36833.1 hypothetical protein D5F52_00220 [Brevibacillus laterosporus]MBG9789734.1 hypothetical protein [Brevibacillus laterosporus]MBM7111399.1 hypothetical protein [Brevibacillus laterosporus]MCG7320260.1 hypothetical protein [Brevibacillus laterosporus]MED1788354.1 hypothetical protein [Brevibacillus laterosporus]
MEFSIISSLYQLFFLFLIVFVIVWIYRFFSQKFGKKHDETIKMLQKVVDLLEEQNKKKKE